MFREGDKVKLRNPNDYGSAVHAAKGYGWNGKITVVHNCYEKDTNVVINFDVAGVRLSIPKQDVIMEEEAIKPKYYKFNIKGKEVDIFDVAISMNLPFTLASALKYIARVKGDKSKRINDLEKAIECIQREIIYIKES